ncbi:hypothetical protein HDU76_002813 [Blyttiomyces sp. JEL0837]|nr:hypothetical protein HDU76_002813 [Blyttiomyces sp. JEL0837]
MNDQQHNPPITTPIPLRLPMIPDFILPEILNQLSTDITSLHQTRRVSHAWQCHSERLFFRRIMLTIDTTTNFLEWATPLKSVPLSTDHAEISTTTNNDNVLASSKIPQWYRRELNLVQYIELQMPSQTWNYLPEAKRQSWRNNISKLINLLPNFKGIFYKPFEMTKFYDEQLGTALVSKRGSLTHVDLFPCSYGWCNPQCVRPSVVQIVNVDFARRLLAGGALWRLQVVNLDLSLIARLNFDNDSEDHGGLEGNGILDVKCLQNLVNVKTMVLSTGSVFRHDTDPWLFPRILTNLPSSLVRLKLTVNRVLLLSWGGESFQDNTTIKPYKNLHSLSLDIFINTFNADSLNMFDEPWTRFKTAITNMFSWFMPNIQRIHCSSLAIDYPTITFNLAKVEYPASVGLFEMVANSIARSQSCNDSRNHVPDSYFTSNPSFIKCLDGLQVQDTVCSIPFNRRKDVDLPDTLNLTAFSFKLTSNLVPLFWRRLSDILDDCRNIRHFTFDIRSNLDRYWVTYVFSIIKQKCVRLHSLTFRITGPHRADEKKVGMLNTLAKELLIDGPQTLRVLWVEWTGMIQDLKGEWVDMARERGIRLECSHASAFGDITYPSCLAEL